MSEIGSVTGDLAATDDTSLGGLQEAALASAAAGDVHTAVRLGADLLTALTDTVGEHHPDTLMMAVLLAGWRLNIGDAATALTTVRELIPISTQVLGADHPSTLAARHTWAGCDAALGLSPAQALPVWVALYGDEQRVFGPEHHCTLGARHQIGELRRQLGDRIGARDELVAAAHGIRRTLGDQHPESVAVQLTAAVCVGEAGDAASAVAEFDRLIPLLTAVLGHDHQHTLLARHTRALWLTPGEGDLLDRVSDWEVLVDDEVRALGEQNQLTVSGWQTLREQRAAWQQFLDEYEAVAMEVSVDFELDDVGDGSDTHRAWGDPGSLDNAGQESTAENAREVRAELAELMNAVVQAKKTVAHANRLAGPTSEAALQRRFELADLLRRGRRYEAARAHTEAFIDECSHILGEGHSLTQAAHSLLRVIDRADS
jgi:hypothetical protein